MFRPDILHKLRETAVLTAIFLVPLLLFVETKDQFELPKLTLLTFLCGALWLFSPGGQNPFRPFLLPSALVLLLAAQVSAALPGNSLSWRTSLLGEYENFAGLATFLALLAWFGILLRILEPALLRKILRFNGWAALLSALYAVAQRYGFDFIQWDPLSVNPTREFACLGNPNFLAAYLALSIPLLLFEAFQEGLPHRLAPRMPGPFLLSLGALAFLFLLLATAQGRSTFGLPMSDFPDGAFRVGGFLLAAGTLAALGSSRSILAIIMVQAVLWMGLFATESRGGFLAAATGCLLWYLLSLQAGLFRRPRFTGPTALPKVLLGGILTLSALAWFGRPFLERLVRSILDAEGSLETSRLHIWGPAWRMAAENPWTGTGLDTFKIAFPFYSGREFNEIDGMFVSSRAAHNEWLQAAATTGFPGLLAALLLLSAFVWTLSRAWRAAPASRPLLAALAASAAAFQVQNLFSFGVAALNLVWFFLMAAAQVLASEGPRREGREVPGLPLVLGGLLGIGLVLFPLQRLAADIAFGRGMAGSEWLKRTDVGDPRWRDRSGYSIHWMGRAVELLPLEVKYRLYLGLAFEHHGQREEDGREWQLQALEHYERSLEMSPANAYYHNNRGRILATLGRKESARLPEAEASFRTAVHLAPHSPLFNLNWGVALSELGREKEARERIQAASELNAGFTAQVLGQMLELEGLLGNRQRAKRLEGLLEAVKE